MAEGLEVSRRGRPGRGGGVGDHEDLDDLAALDGEAQIIFDRFHIQRLAHDALDEVRRAQAREVDTEADKTALKKSRWALQKNPWNLSRTEKDKLAQVQKANRPLYRAYLLKESLLHVLDRHQIHVAETKLDEWLDWARRSRLAPFVKPAAPVRDHRSGILAYVRTRLSNGRTEALNGKIRTITRRAYGFHNAFNLIALIMLCCSGIHLSPVFHYQADAILIMPHVALPCDA
jgi:transposase